MKRFAFILTMLFGLVLAGCSSTGNKAVVVDQPTEYGTAVKDAKVSVDFLDNGIKIHYTLSGKLEKIEVTGIAEAWKKQHDELAEADAKVKLSKFIHGESITNSRTTKVIAKAIERAQDDVLNEFKSKEGTLTPVIKAGEQKEDQDLMTTEDDSEGTQKSNTALRKAGIINTTLVTTITEIKTGGRLTGLRKTKDGVKDDGKLYVAVYEWSEKDQVTADQIRAIMSRR